VFFGLRSEAQFVYLVDNLAQVVAALNLVLDLAENLPNLVVDGVRATRLLLESMKVREKLSFMKSRRSSPVIALL